MYNNNYAPMFPQPNGNVYVIQNSLEVANIPAGAGVTAAICLSENLIYLKTIQNGVPTFLAYRLTPYSEAPKAQTAAPTVEERLAALEQKFEKIGGKRNDGKHNDVPAAAANEPWDA